jgi:hypothetical protein
MHTQPHATPGLSYYLMPDVIPAIRQSRRRSSYLNDVESVGCPSPRHVVIVTGVL